MNKRKDTVPANATRVTPIIICKLQKKNYRPINYLNDVGSANFNDNFRYTINAYSFIFYGNNMCFHRLCAFRA